MIEEKPTAAALQELYWRQGKTCGEIGEMFGVSDMTISRWLRKSGINLRNKSETSRLINKRCGNTRKREAARRNIAKANSEKKNVNHKFTRYDKRRGGRTTADFHKKRRIVVKCANPDCSVLITLCPSDVVASGNCCSRSCSTKWQHIRRREEIEYQRLKTLAHQVFGKP